MINAPFESACRFCVEPDNNGILRLRLTLIGDVPKKSITMTKKSVKDPSKLVINCDQDMYCDIIQ